MTAKNSCSKFFLFLLLQMFYLHVQYMNITSVQFTAVTFLSPSLFLFFTFFLFPSLSFSFSYFLSLSLTFFLFLLLSFPFFSFSFFFSFFFPTWPCLHTWKRERKSKSEKRRLGSRRNESRSMLQKFGVQKKKKNESGPKRKLHFLRISPQFLII